MANDVNLSPARILRVAIAHTLGNGIKFEQVGTLQALRSPQLKGITDELQPTKAKEEGRLSFRQGSNGPDDIIPTVKFNYKQQYMPTSKGTARQVDADGDAVRPAQELDVDFNLYRQYNHKFNTIDFHKLEPLAAQYLKETKAGVTVTLSKDDLNELVLVGTEILDTVEGGLLTDMNGDMLNMLIANRGGNLVVGQASPANKVEPVVPLYNAEGMPSRDLLEAINELKRKHQITGTVIIIGGAKLAKWWDLKGFVGMSDIGLDLKEVYNKLPAEFYYDPTIDIRYGADKILILDPGSACGQTILEHKYIVKQKEVAQTSFGQMSLAINQYDSPTFLMDFDLRVRAYDTGKYPHWIVTPSAKYGGFVRPAGFFKTYGGFTTVTGVYGYQLVDRAPAE
ncbi:hypothetical protein [Spirosoma sordidisoli]|uniref:Phage major capsid protein n=1 Tax=Spirosoma sordidisoli TaxID=2502893 RepID=A0A4Q2UG38_9BACT|nr:hypothetical protein [Spirosoma sordidisoli]RYC66345.1 hypothetical protein EQG79_30185 [Spirosoma sordidisoli]